MSGIESASPPPPSNLEELTLARATNPAWRVDLMLKEVGGGRLSESALQAIETQPQATALRVSGLDQATFETLVHRHGQQFTAIQLWKCPRIEDFSALEDLPNLALVSIYWNQRASRLWNLSKTPKLRGLEFEDFTRLRDLEDLRNAVAVEELSFGDKVWVKASMASLEPLTAVETVRRVSFALRKIDDGRIQPLGQLAALERLDCPSNLFTTEQLAWLRAHLPDTVEGRVLAPIQQFDKPLPSPNANGPGRDVLVMGKRKPFLNSQADASKVQRFVDDYWKMVSRFRADPALEPGSA